MEKRILKSNYAKIDKNIITLYEKSPTANGLDNIIEEATIEIEGTILSISGKKWKWGFAKTCTPVSKLTNKPIDLHIKYYYASFTDLFRRKKTPYVDGWYLLNKRDDFNALISHWLIVL